MRWLLVDHLTWTRTAPAVHNRMDARVRFNQRRRSIADVQLRTAGARARVLQLHVGIDPMFIMTYRRTGGMFALLTLAAVAFAATVLTVAVAATILIVALAASATALLARAVLPAWWRRHTVPPATRGPQETFEATVVNPTGSSDEVGLLRNDSDKG